MRQVFISEYRDILKDAKTYNQSAAGKADLKQRPRVERVIANLVRYHDARQARWRGTVNADYQAKKAGPAFNLRQWLRLRQKRAKAARLAAAEAALSQAAPPTEAPDCATLRSQLLARSC
jgi:hypothetical protein